MFDIGLYLSPVCTLVLCVCYTNAYFPHCCDNIDDIDFILRYTNARID